MGQKSSSNGGEKRAFGLKVAMTCHCKGCIHKIRNAVKHLAVDHGVEKVDQSALWTKGEVSLVATADPEKLRQRLRKDTDKNVVLVVVPDIAPGVHAPSAPYAPAAPPLPGQHAPSAPYAPSDVWYDHGAPAAQVPGCPWAVQPEAYLYPSYPATWEPYMQLNQRDDPAFLLLPVLATMLLIFIQLVLVSH